MAESGDMEADLVVDGTTYRLAWRASLMAKFEARTKRTTGQALLGLTMTDYTTLSELLWTWLQTHHGKEFRADKSGLPVMEKVYDLLDKAGGHNGVMQAVTDLVAAMKKASQDDEPIELETV